MVHLFPECVVYVDSDEDDFYDQHPGLTRNLDVHDCPQNALESYIRAAMRGRDVEMFFYFTEPKILIRLQGGLDNDIYSENDAFDVMLTTLVTAQGLFLGTKENIWSDQCFEADLARYADE